MNLAVAVLSLTLLLRLTRGLDLAAALVCSCFICGAIGLLVTAATA